MAHIDDIIIVSPKKERIKQVLDALNRDIKVKDLGEASIFLGMEIKRDRVTKTLELHQKAYTERILAKYRPNLKPKTSAKGQMIPMSVGQDLDVYEEQQDPEVTKQYQREVGSILYLSNKTRPDIAYVIGVLSRYLSNPGPQHLNALDQLWEYLANWPNLGILFNHPEPILQHYVDSDYGGDKMTRRSTTGYISLFRGGPIAWQSRLQKTVALSSCEAEYMALREAIKEQLYLANIGKELPMFEGYIQGQKVYTDSQSAIKLALNPRHHQRTKHVDILYHFIRERVQSKDVELIHIGTKNQLADYLTKAMASTNWPEFISKIGLKAR